jgi:histone acetyltransferase MYST2
VETPPQSKAPSSAVESGPLSESDGEGSKNAVITRKLTRSSSARRSKHLVGKTSDTESESESKTSASAASKSPVKKAAGPKGPCPRKSKGRGGTANSDTSQTPTVEERHCPVDGCDSMGHLGGRAEKHFTIEACPKYHNKTAQECKDIYLERRKREEERRKAVTLLSKKSPKSHHLTIEQRHYQMKIKELRAKSERRSNNNNSDPETDSSAPEEKDRERQPRLTNITSEYDLKLFQEALAVASEKIEDDLKCLPHVKGTKYIEIGKYEVEVWYQSPYPEDYARVPKLYLCEYCLRYMKSRTILKRHIVKCVWRHPPGEEVYRKEKISVWEVDGKRYKQYCQNLCLLAKFFLDHKTLYYDVEPFLFYVMTIGDSDGCHTVGYFSKEKNSFLNYNVSCILTLPPYQRQGYGRLLIDFSYLLTRVEGKVGSPEKPLSDLGLISYRSYWKDVLLEYLCNFGGKELSVKDISQEMAINSYDIVSTLQALGMMKYWKGKHIILKKQDVIDEYVERMKRRGPMYKAIDPTYLKWTPFVAPAATGPT